MTEKFFSEISDSPINILSALNFIADEAHGGTAIFQGTVRNRNNNRDVIAVSYDVHKSLAINSFTNIYQDIIKSWGDQFKIYISHFSGRLQVNGVSVVIAVSSIHRDEAFKACRYIIESIKHQSPIWKQEHYTDGDSEWVQGHALCRSAAHETTND